MGLPPQSNLWRYFSWIFWRIVALFQFEVLALVDARWIHHNQRRDADHSWRLSPHCSRLYPPSTENSATEQCYSGYGDCNITRPIKISFGSGSFSSPKTCLIRYGECQKFTVTPPRSTVQLPLTLPFSTFIEQSGLNFPDASKIFWINLASINATILIYNIFRSELLQFSELRLILQRRPSISRLFRSMIYFLKELVTNKSANIVSASCLQNLTSHYVLLEHFYVKPYLSVFLLGY